MHNISLKWSNLTNSQKDQVKGHYKEQLRKKEMFEHSLNVRSFKINPLSGAVIL